MNDEIDVMEDVEEDLSLGDEIQNAMEEHSEEGSSERLRDEQGRFASQTEETATTGPSEGAETASEEEIALPASWSPEKKDLYINASPELREYINQREAEVGKGFATRAEQLKDYQNRYNAVSQSLEPLRPMLAQSNVSEAQYVQGLVQADAFIRQNPQQAIQEIARSHNIDLEELAFAPVQQPQGPNPEVMALKQELAGMKGQLNNWQQQATESYEGQVHEQIASFAGETSETGEVLHPHFETVKPLMASLLQTGQAEGLQDAYEMAVYAHPNVRNDVIGSLTSQAEANANQKAAAAKAKSTSIRGTPSAGVTAEDQPANTLREEIARNMAAGAGRV
jgi:hypothetical protein